MLSLWRTVRACALFPWVLAVLLCPLSGRADTTACPSGSTRPGSLWVSADFDGDDVPDFAHVNVRWAGDGFVASGAAISAPCARRPALLLGNLPHAGLVLSARDVDADHDRDLVLHEPVAGRTLGVWINDGEGGFSVADPAEFPASGDSPFTCTPRPSRVPQPVAVPGSKTHDSTLPAAATGYALRRQPPLGRACAPAIARRSRDADRSRAPPLYFS
jgi:hypothetical protein